MRKHRGENMAMKYRSGGSVHRNYDYVFNNSSAQTKDRFDALSTVFDPGTKRHIADRDIAKGWECLEVGAGGGSIAAWLCNCVGSRGRVVATDIDTRFLERLQIPNLEVQRHDIVNDPLPSAAFDLIHARLVLSHLPERERALARMVNALKPGGCLIVEDFDSLSVLPDSTVNGGEVPLRTGVALRQLLSERGVALQYGRLLPRRLKASELVDVVAEARAFIWQGGSAGAKLNKANYLQLRNAIIDSGLITEEQFEQDLARLDEEDFFCSSPVMWAACGRRPVREATVGLNYRVPK